MPDDDRSGRRRLGCEALQAGGAADPEGGLLATSIPTAGEASVSAW